METAIGVFGEELLLWICMLRQSPRRPPADQVHRHANMLLDELKGSALAHELPVTSVDDGMFVIAAWLDEVAMSLPDLRPLWHGHPLQATRWMTNNAGVEVFERLQRVRQGPRTVIATYAVVLGCGFMGQYGLPGQDKYHLEQLRIQLRQQLGVDPDRDVQGGALRPIRYDVEPSTLLPKEPWYKSIWLGRILVLLFVMGGGAAFGLRVYAAL